jgi:hypothetical protein
MIEAMSLWSYMYEAGCTVKKFALGQGLIFCSPLETRTGAATTLERGATPLDAEPSSYPSNEPESTRIGVFDITRAYPEVWLSYGVTVLLLAGTWLYFRKRLRAAERLLPQKRVDFSRNAEHVHQLQEKPTEALGTAAGDTEALHEPVLKEVRVKPVPSLEAEEGTNDRTRRRRRRASKQNT